MKVLRIDLEGKNFRVLVENFSNFDFKDLISVMRNFGLTEDEDFSRRVKIFQENLHTKHKNKALKTYNVNKIYRDKNSEFQFEYFPSKKLIVFYWKNPIMKVYDFLSLLLSI